MIGKMGMLNLKLIGHYRYYGISFNGRMISNYKQQVRELLFKVLNRRSDRKSYTREGFIEMLKYYPLAMPKIYVSLFWDCKYYYEEPYARKPHVRFCEGLTLWGVSLLDCGEISWTFPIFQGLQSLVWWNDMYFPLFLPLWDNREGNKGNFFLVIACHLVEKPCWISLSFSGGVGIDIHCGTDIWVS